MMNARTLLTREGRELGAKFFDLLPTSRARLAPIGRNGEDAEITRWFSPETGHRRSP
jgi:hypothetical protein